MPKLQYYPRPPRTIEPFWVIWSIEIKNVKILTICFFIFWGALLLGYNAPHIMHIYAPLDGLIFVNNCFKYLGYMFPCVKVN